MSMTRLKRREFMMLVGGAAAAWPLATRAQQIAMPVIGFVDSGSQVASAHFVAAFRQGLNEAGCAEAQDVRVEFRWANGEYNRLSALTAELVRIPVSVLAAGGGEPAARAAKAASMSIPIVFMNQVVEELATEHFELLHELVPQTPVIAMLVDPNFPTTEAVVRNAEAAMCTLGCKLQVLRAGADEDVDTAFMILALQHIRALFVAPAPFFYNRRDRIIELAAHYRICTLYVRREFAAGGGLMSYGSSLPDTYRQLGVYAGRILRGEKPADLRVVQPINFELVINLKTAKALGVRVAPELLARADEVIEQTS